MKYFKSTFMWIIILVAIAGYSYMDFEHTKIEEERRDQETRLLKFSPGEVVSITIINEKNEIEIERWEEGWKIIRPVKAKADAEQVEKFLGYVTDSRNDADYVMDPDPTPERLAEFGLANPKMSVTLKVGKELKPYKLIFGDRAPTMGVAFARLDGYKPIYRVLADARGEADKDVHYFRDKSVLRLQPVMIDQWVIRRKDSSIRVKLPDTGKWEIEKPFKARADHNKIFEVLGVFANAEVKHFVDETKDNIAKYGLDKPSIEMSFWLAGDAEPTIKLTVGDRSPEKRGYYVAMSDRDNVFILEEEVINAIPRHMNDVRNRELFFFERDKLKRIEIRKPKKSIVLVKDIEKEWRRNNESGEKVDFNLVKEFLGDLLDSRIEEFVSDDEFDLKQYGLGEGGIALLIWPEGSSVPFSLNVGRKMPTGGQVYARSGAERGVLALDERVKRILTTYF